MMPEDKDLLLKDLCTRLPYGVKCEVIKRSIDGEMLFIRNNSGALRLTIDNFKDIVTNNLYEIKPYLFPLSSMTEEQLLKYHNTCDVGLTEWGNELYYDCVESISWLIENNFDIYGLIPKNLAIDATNLNIY